MLALAPKIIASAVGAVLSGAEPMTASSRIGGEHDLESGYEVNLAASLIVHNELDRYLPVTIASLLTFCDEVVVLDDYSTDDTYDYLDTIPGISLARNRGPSFFEHEGKARQALLDWTLKGNPTHILALDADEIVTDGQAVRRAIERPSRGGVWTLVMEEVWRADERGYACRQDGGWRAHPVACLYRVDRHLGEMRDNALACGRTPRGVELRSRRSQPTGAAMLHLGWANLSERARRYQRYVEHDGGRFHRSTHLESIMWPDEKVALELRAWPHPMAEYAPEIVKQASRALA